jgi:hypothetical protein
LYDIFLQRFGNKAMTPRKIRIIPEKYDQKLVGISINKLVHFNNNEKIIIEIQREIIITNGVFLLLS